MRTFILALVAVSLGACFVACRTRPLHEHGARQPGDLGSADLSDLADLAEPDLIVADLTPIPDLLPPPDLTLPFICRNVYVVDSNGMLSAFDTNTHQFFDIGVLHCPSTGNSQPFSMSIARDSTAYVLYENGEVFAVNTMNASCKKTVFMPNQKGFLTFGMGFVADEPGSQTETLYVASATKLAKVAFPDMTISVLGSMQGNPELTGTADGELWGFFPSTDSVAVTQIDKTNGALGTSLSLPTLLGSPRSWAFAFWGGSFWIFFARQSDPSTSVYRLDRTTGQVAKVVSGSGRQIVGAGVSSCAPTELPDMGIGLDQ